MAKPVFNGNVNDVRDILAYEDAVREWELLEKALSVPKGDPIAPLAGLFDDGTRPLQQMIEGPEGRQGPPGPAGGRGRDGAGDLDEVLITNAGDLVVSEAGFIVTEGGTAV